MKTRKKNTRQRGSHTHGCGSMKKRRGAGHRGGRGNAGSGKRGDAKKPSFWKNSKDKGFISLKKPSKSINIRDLHSLGETTLNLSNLGYHKLLGVGSVSQKFTITVSKASQKAKDKISAAGGTIKEENGNSGQDNLQSSRSDTA